MKKGFTLLELLIVIAILAILATVVILVLNPAEYLKQTRDARRMSDLGTVRDSINLFLATTSTPGLTAATTCTVTACTGCPLGTCTANLITLTNGTGWVNVNFNSLTNGSPISKLPLDPTNSTTNYYAYRGWTDAGSNPQFELDTVLESAKYSPNNGTDGGNQASWYELGSNITTY